MGMPRLLGSKCLYTCLQLACSFEVQYAVDWLCGWGWTYKIVLCKGCRRWYCSETLPSMFITSCWVVTLHASTT
jgi:hypothetical protein